jgi:hypothetical protein
LIAYFYLLIPTRETFVVKPSVAKVIFLSNSTKEESFSSF